MKIDMPKGEPVKIYGDTKPENQCLEKVEGVESLFFEDYARRVFDALLIPQNNVIVTGANGVGKTSLVKHIQYLADTYKSPMPFYNMKIWELIQLRLTDGIQKVSDYEDRLNGVFEYIMDNTEKRVLFIDNIASIINDNVVNLMIWQHIERAIKYGVKVICCCNNNELKSIENKYDLLRHFTRINVKPQSIENTKEILHKKIAHYNQYFRTVMDEQTTDKIVALSDKYVKNGFQMPKKAVLVMEHIYARHANRVHTPDAHIAKRASQLEDKKKEIKDAVNHNDGSIKDSMLRILKLNEEVSDLECSINDLSSMAFKSQTDNVITDEDVFSAISDMAGVPVAKLTESDMARMKNMESDISKKVIGQDEAVSMVCKTVKRNRLGIRKKNHTVGNFIFLGSTGVGKTFLAKKLSEYLFGSEDSMVRLDMSEYSDEISVNKLIGAPPGYVGYGEGGVLCNAIKNNPYSVILFDEIEKAHPSIFNTILQLLDEGYITDANGVKHSAVNTIIILTSNAGVKEAKNAGGVIGFASEKDDLERRNEENRKKIIEKTVNKIFSPEFLNRIDSICYFNELGESELEKIFNNEIDEVRQSLSDLGYSLSISGEAKSFIVKKSAEEKMGARALIRAIQHDISDEITDLIINDGEGKNKVSVGVDKKNNKLKFSVSTK